jgi:DNA-directed RNA polymerase beta' subunit
MFVPQSIQTQMELANIAGVKSHVISPRFSATIIKLKQDTVIGSYLMTSDNQIIDWHDAMNLIMSTRNITKKIPKEHIKNSKLFSMIIPNQINLRDKKVHIVNGNIQSGTIDGGILNKSIINFCWDKYGADTTKNFIDNSQLLICNYLLYNGFSVGVMDGRLTPEKQDLIGKIVEEKKIEAEHLLTEIENNPDLLDPSTAEDQIRGLLATIKEIGRSVG